MVRVFFGVPESYGNSPQSIWALLGHTGIEERGQKEGGVPPGHVYKEVEEGERAGPYGAPWRSPTPTGSRNPPLPSSRSRRQGRGRKKRRKEGAQPLPLVQFGLGLGGRGLP